MKALSLWQPWATLIAIGAKCHETRSWRTDYRGPVAIHAAKRFPGNCQELCFDQPFFSALEAAGDWVPDADLPAPSKPNLPLGAIIAVVELVTVYPIYGDPPLRRPHIPGLEISDRELAFGDWTPGRVAWQLGHARRLPRPIPCRGAQGLWSVAADVDAEIRRQLGEGESDG